MTALRALLLLALLDASCAFSMQQPTLVSRGRAMPQQKRLVHRCAVRSWKRWHVR